MNRWCPPLGGVTVYQAKKRGLNSARHVTDSWGQMAERARVGVRFRRVVNPPNPSNPSCHTNPLPHQPIPILAPPPYSLHSTPPPLFPVAPPSLPAGVTVRVGVREETEAWPQQGHWLLRFTSTVPHTPTQIRHLLLRIPCHNVYYEDRYYSWPCLTYKSY